jgi:hypothetical protein
MDVRRGSDITMVCGTNNTGKSVIAKELIKKYNEKRDKLIKNKKYPDNYNKLIVYDPQEYFTDLMREGDINIQLNNENWEEELLNYRASLVVIDDYKELFQNDTLSKGFMNVMSNRARYGLDFIMITWSPKLILPRLTHFINKYILLKSNSSEKEFRERIGGENDVVEGIRLALNSEYAKYTESEYSALYPNFPFIYLDTARNIVKKINFKN